MTRMKNFILNTYKLNFVKLNMQFETQGLLEV
jgi:hypothetical protein